MKGDGKMSSNSEIIIYRTPDGKTKIDVTLEDGMVWLSQAQMVDLYQTTKQNISLHINNIFKEGELESLATVKEYLTVQSEGAREVKRSVKYYNLDVIIAVGYRIKSPRGTQFRQWATQVLHEYLQKGFKINADLLKKAGGGGYWRELLETIRDIRSSEKVFYRQVLDIYATSIDYDPRAEISQLFFQTVQNKMHYAAHGHTAAEIIMLRANSETLFMGMTSFEGAKPRKSDAIIAKNYLRKDEMEILNGIVSAYLEFAELQAVRRKPMTMKDWIERLDDFIRMDGSKLLENAGRISRLEAAEKAELEYEKYKAKMKDELSQVELDFLDSIKDTQKKLKKGAKK
jgi:hypothetical protein